MLGALIRVTKLIKIDTLNVEVTNQFGDRIGERNITVIKRAHDEVEKHV